MKKLKVVLLILITFSVLTPLISYNLNNHLGNVEENPKKTQNSKSHLNFHVKNLKTSKTWENFTFIHITGANWSIAATYDWCDGSGTLEDPYVIKNMIIDAGGSGSGILIENSTNKYFEINNCTVYNSGEGHYVGGHYYRDGGIKLYNTSNGKIINNDCSQNKNGIYLSYSDNNTIAGNTVNNNSIYGGIYLWNSDKNTISGNNATKNENGIYLEYSNGNIISENTVNNNNIGIFLMNGNDNSILKNTISFNEFHGIFLQYNNNTSISGNILKDNKKGISLVFSNNNTVSRNTVYKNGFGVSIDYSNNTIIWGNLFQYNKQFGIYIADPGCQSNLIYSNSMKRYYYLGELASDSGNNTQWDYLGIGNYWNIHSSPDIDNDGIVDTPYTGIIGSAGSNDSYPLTKSPIHEGEKIHIDDSGVNAWNWSKTTRLKVWCSGSGTEEDPYVIRDLIINIGGSESSILIENSKVYFKIENCQIYNAKSAINLFKTINGKIINNECFLNEKGIFLDQSNNNNISGNAVNNNNVGIFLSLSSNNNTISGNDVNNNYYGIGLFLYCNNNTISGNNATENEYGIGLLGCDDNTVLENTANNNIYGITLSSSNNNTVSRNTANNNIYGIYLLKCNNNTVSRNILVLNVFFIEEDNCIGNNIEENNKYYTTILGPGINEVKIEPYRVDNVDVDMEIALYQETEVVFSAYNYNNMEDAPLNNGLMFMNLRLNDTNNLNQSLDDPIKFKLKFDSNKYIPLGVFWFNEFANGEQGAWEKIAFTDHGNGKIIISVNHTSIFAIIGEIKSFPSSSSNNDDEAYDFLFLILVVFICSLTIITASSTYYYKTKIQTRAKPPKKEALMQKPLARSYDKKNVKSQNLKDHVENKNVLRFLKEKNALENPVLFENLKINAVPKEFWEKIADIELEDKDKLEFINEILSFTPKEREEVFDTMFTSIKNPLVKGFDEKVVKSQNLKDYVENKNILKFLKKKNALEKPALFDNLKINVVSNEFWEKIADIELEDKEKVEFINEILSFPPKERHEIIDDILKVRESDSEDSNQQAHL